MLTIVLVDDEQEILQGLQRLIDWEGLGYKIVFSTINPVEALSYIALLSPDVVITDIRMPVYSGLDLIRKITSLSPATRSIILSGYDDFAYVKEALQLGVYNYLLKPVDEDELISSLTAIRDQALGNCTRGSGFGDSFPLLHKLIQSSAAPEGMDLEAVYNLNSHGPYHLIHFLPDSAKTARNDQFLKEMHRYLLQYGAVAMLSYGDEVYMLFAGKLPAEFPTQIRKTTLTTGSHTAIVYTPAFFNLLQLNALAKTLAKTARADAFFRRTQPLRILPSAAETCSIYRKEWPLLEKKLFRRLELALDGFQLEEIHSLLTDMRNFLANEVNHIRPQEACGAYRDLMNHLWLHLAGLNIVSMNPETLRASALQTDDAADIATLETILQDAVAETFKSIRPSGRNSRVSIRQIQMYIQLHIDENLSLKRIASLFYMSPSYLSTLFVREAGMPLSSYVCRLRLHAAAKLLRETDRPVADICQAVGFSSEKTFFKRFKSSFSATPIQYRKQMRSNNGKSPAVERQEKVFYGNTGE